MWLQFYLKCSSKPPFYRGNIQHQIESVVPCSIAERRKQLEVVGTDLIPETWEKTVAACLSKDPKDRPTDVAEVWARLSGKASVQPEQRPKPSLETTAPTPSPRRKSRNSAGWKTITTAAVVAGLLVGLGIWSALKDVDGEKENNSTGTSGTPETTAESTESGAAAKSTGGADKGKTPEPEMQKSGTMDLKTGSIGDSREFDLGGGEKLVMKYVPGGIFTMGSPPEEEGREENENHVSVTLSSHFWMGETEVTQGQWEAVMGSNPSDFTGDENLPVENVSWEDAQVFVSKLNQNGGQPAGWSWSLPTEAQWERACRAGTETVFSFGESFSSQQARFDDNNPYGGGRGRDTGPVKSYAANDWGLYDMHGNVSEWCLDAWDGGSALQGGIDPVGIDGSSRVYRGGGWNSEAKICRAAFRSKNSPSVRSRSLGFRVALISLPGSETSRTGKADIAESPASSSKAATASDNRSGIGPVPEPSAAKQNVSDLETGEIGDSREFDLGDGETIVMKYVPGGTFTMGSPPEEVDRSEGEAQVAVTLTSHYWLGETEVTQGQWESVMRNNPSHFTGDNDLPVEQVSWEDVHAYLAKLNQKGGLSAGWVWSLPTEAQWERACRAGTETVFSFGDSLSSRQANFDGDFPYGGAEIGINLSKTTPVKSYAPSSWGLYDMHGNVWEWCEDAWDGQSRFPGGVAPLGTTARSAYSAAVAGEATPGGAGQPTAMEARLHTGAPT